MVTIDLAEFDAHKRIMGRLENGPFILELPTVFSLVCLPNNTSIDQLNKAKVRGNNKYYGSLIGNLTNFYKLLLPEIIPPGFSRANKFTELNGSFIRGKITKDTFNSATVKNGTHQGLLLEGPIQELSSAIELNFQEQSDPNLYNLQSYSAPICTSANISGDPNGSITRLEKALEFAEQRNIELVVTIDEKLKKSNRGSYPILWFRENKITIERSGPDLGRFRSIVESTMKE